jgi:hypothetical protein
MKNVVVSLLLILVVTAWLLPLEKHHGACKKMFATMCKKNQECTGQSALSCVLAVQQEKLCERDVTASVADMQTCNRQLLTTSCDSLPESCMFLE